MMERLRARDPSAGEEWSGRLSAIDSELSADTEHRRAEEAKLKPEGGDGSYSSAHNAVQGNMNSIGRCLSVPRDEFEYTREPAFTAPAAATGVGFIEFISGVFAGTRGLNGVSLV